MTKIHVCIYWFFFNSNVRSTITHCLLNAIFNLYNFGVPRIPEHGAFEKCCNVSLLYEVKNLKLPNSIIYNKQGKSKAI